MSTLHLTVAFRDNQQQAAISGKSSIKKIKIFFFSLADFPSSCSQPGVHSISTNSADVDVV
jgi:hypothetical protein